MIYVDDKSTWPADVCRLLDAGLSSLLAFDHERRRVDKLGETDVSYRYRPPPNPYKEARDRLVAEVDDCLRETALAGYHCTRLCADEMEIIRRTGMRPLNAELARERVSRRLAAGDLSPAVAGRLLAESRADDTHLEERRSGMTWFVFTAASLRDEGGLWRLFGHWGGEALYVAHVDDPEVGPLLRALGTACIVEAAVPVRAIETYCSMGERLVRYFLHRRGFDGEHEVDFEGFVREALPGPNIRRIIARRDADFERLTGCCAWNERPT
jgi:hypothetical protein